VVSAIVDELIDDLAPRGRAELMTEFFEPLSVVSLARLIGLGHIDAATLQRWFHGLSDGASNFESDPRRQSTGDAASREIDELLTPFLAERMQHPDDTMVSHLLQSCEGSPEQRIASMMPTLKLVLIGGLQEPGHGGGSTLLGLLTHAGQWDNLVADPEGLVRKSVEEGLRWLSPIGEQTRGSGSNATLSGVTIPPGERVALLVASANRDEIVFGPTADVYELDRPRHPHAGFGFGPHFCVGHYLARIQVRTAIQRLAERLPGLDLDSARPVSVRGWEYRAPTSLTARWTS
jgi:cytochrome P450